MSKVEMQATLTNLPHKPGVYRYYTLDGALLYVGKAKDLKKRVSNYFQSSKTHNARMALMISQIDRIEYTIVDSEKESLILESNLIHSLQPKYNVLLKDDKNYVYVRITSDPVPSVTLVRRKFDPRSTYFGPYTRKSGIYETLRVLRQIFPYCQEKQRQIRPCSYYGIKQCDGICAGLESKEDYNQKINQIKSVLEGRTDDVEAWLNVKIKIAVDDNSFELAALWRDRINTLKMTIGTQKMILPYPEDINILSMILYRDSEGLMIGSVFVEYIRSGRVNNVINAILSGSSDQNTFQDELDQTQIKDIAAEFLVRFFQNLAVNQLITSPFLIKSYILDETAVLTPNIIPSQLAADTTFIQFGLTDTQLIQEITGMVVQQKYTRDLNKNEINKLFKHNTLNAYNYLLRNKNQERLNIFEENNLYKNLLSIQESLSLTKTPRRIECYDISHISGKFVYGSMVTFLDGRPAKKWYRLFKTKDQNNDFENMKEVLMRRVQRYYTTFSDEMSNDISRKGWDKPDLIIIDGGKGQLGSALAAVDIIKSKYKDDNIDKNMCFDSEICSLAKKEELLFLPHNPHPIAVQGEVRFMIQRIRDEAHRFAITNNRNARLKTASKSELDDIKGIGEVTKLKALRTFGSIKGLVEALDKNQELVVERLGNSTTKILKKYYGL